MLLEISRVTNDAEHAHALARIRILWDRESDDAVDELNILTMLVDDYERKRWPSAELGDPIDILVGAISHAGHTRTDLARLVGSVATVDDLLSRKRPLTLDMIRSISVAWGLPQELLTRAYPLATGGTTP